MRVRVPPRAFRPRGGTVLKNTEREAQQYFSRSRFLASDKNGGRVAEMEYAQGLEPCSWKRLWVRIPPRPIPDCITLCIHGIRANSMLASLARICGRIRVALRTLSPLWVVGSNPTEDIVQ